MPMPMPMPPPAPVAPTASTASGASASSNGQHGMSGLPPAILGGEVPCLPPSGSGLVESHVAEAVICGADRPGSRPA
jgi:hypothetical protein